MIHNKLSLLIQGMFIYTFTGKDILIPLQIFSTLTQIKNLRPILYVKLKKKRHIN